MFYASKYVCRLDTDAVESSGRFWGLHNTKEIPWAKAVKVPLDGQQAVRIMRIARRIVGVPVWQGGLKKRCTKLGVWLRYSCSSETKTAGQPCLSFLRILF